MELNITQYFNNGDHWNTSNSIANLGNNAAAITWETAKTQALDFNYVNDETRQELRDYFLSFGAWGENEVNSWDDQELNALLLQEISAQINEIEGLDLYTDGIQIDWDQYHDLANEGTILGNMFSDTKGGIYIYIGN